jgi:hypothetical protein
LEQKVLADNKKIIEVKRQAETGEYIKTIVNDKSFKRFKKGDVFKVAKDFSNETNHVWYGKGVVYHHKICDNWVLSNDEYVVLSNYDVDDKNNVIKYKIEEKEV